jgi:antitoxin component of MazEF toxin-antitoxin module
MIKKLTTIGNSYGLVLDKAILELLNITPETELELTIDMTRLIIEPVGAKSRRPSRATEVIPPKPPKAGRRYGFSKKQPW